MIVALLILIVLILLFGAGVVKGWLANALGVGCGGLAILVALIWLGSFFGENGFQYILWTIVGVMLLLVAIGLAFDPNKPSRQVRVRPRPSSPAAIPIPAQAPPPRREPLGRERVWEWYSDDIVHRFSPEAKAKARELYGRNDVLGLDRLCREEMARLEG